MIPTDFATCLIMSTDTQSHIFISAQQIAIYIIVLSFSDSISRISQIFLFPYVSIKVPGALYRCQQRQ